MKIDRRTTLKTIGAGLAITGVMPLIEPAKALTRRDLFEPINLAGLDLRNRIIRSATSMEMADENGNPTPELLKVYEDVAQGGASLIITGLAYVRKEDQLFHSALGFYDDSQIPGFKKLTEVIRNNGAKSCLQIGYAGSFSGYKTTEREIWGPSVVEHPMTKVTSQEMTKDDIRTVIRTMAAAAVRAKKAGFDAIELHFVHNFMLNQFLVPFFNRRTDEYGGSIENRARLAFEITEAVRTAVGNDYPVIAKVHGQDYLEKDGMTLDEGIYLAQGLVQRGVNVINVSGGNLISTPETLPLRPEIADDPELQSYFAEDAAALEKTLDVPLILTGGNRDPKVMQEVLDTNGDIVAFAMARTILSEPDFPNLIHKDRNHEPQCVSCNWCIQHYGTQPTMCVQNT